MRALRHLLGAGLAAALLVPSTAAAAPQLVKLGDFSTPVYVAGPPGDASRVFVVEQSGRIQLLVDGARQSTPFLDVSGDTLTSEERGLLSMAFAPDYASSGRFWVYMTVKAAAATNGSEGQIQVREYQRADADHASPSPSKLLLAIDHDQADNHNGGQLQVGPDGMLWLATGDGGGADNSAVPGSAQSTTNLLGKLLRIDPNRKHGYSIPRSNPFASGPGRDELYAMGLRNPYRFSFDRATTDLWIGDVGQDKWEEIDHESLANARGANFGWDLFEGTHPFEGNPSAPPNYRPPVFEYSSAGADCTVIGGYVSRDPSVPKLRGRYLYADFCGGAIRSFDPGNPGASDAPTGLHVDSASSFGEDNHGSIYVTSLSGPVYRIGRR
jgi:glucose/arabinose dehydrogenase